MSGPYGTVKAFACDDTPHAPTMDEARAICADLTTNYDALGIMEGMLGRPVVSAVILSAIVIILPMVPRSHCVCRVRNYASRRHHACL